MEFEILELLINDFCRREEFSFSSTSCELLIIFRRIIILTVGIAVCNLPNVVVENVGQILQIQRETNYNRV